MPEVVQALISDILRPYRSAGAVASDLLKTEAALGVVKLRRSASNTLRNCAFGAVGVFFILFGLFFSISGGLFWLAIQVDYKTAVLVSISLGVVAIICGALIISWVLHRWKSKTPIVETQGTNHIKEEIAHEHDR